MFDQLVRLGNHVKQIRHNYDEKRKDKEAINKFLQKVTEHLTAIGQTWRCKTCYLHDIDCFLCEKADRYHHERNAERRQHLVDEELRKAIARHGHEHTLYREPKLPSKNELTRWFASRRQADNLQTLNEAAALASIPEYFVILCKQIFKLNQLRTKCTGPVDRILYECLLERRCLLDKYPVELRGERDQYERGPHFVALAELLQFCKDQLEIEHIVGAQFWHNIWCTEPAFDYGPHFPHLLPLRRYNSIWDHTLRYCGLEQRVIATHPLPVGHFIAIESAIAATVDVRAIRRHCAHCFTEALAYTMLACGNCTSAMFCSRTCRYLSARSRHWYECRIALLLHQHPELRPLVRLLVDTFHTPQDAIDMQVFCAAQPLRAELEEHGRRGRYQPAHRLNYIAGERRLENAKFIWSLQGAGEQQLEPMDVWLYARQAAVVIHALSTRTTFMARCFPTAKQRAFLHAFCRRVLPLLALYADRPHRIGSRVRAPDATRGSVARVSTRAVYPLWAQMGHACQPNVRAVPLDATRMLLVAVRPIAVGEALTVDRSEGVFDDDDQHHWQHTLWMRAQRLHASCQCHGRANPRFATRHSMRFKEGLSQSGWAECCAQFARLLRAGDERTAEAVWRFYTEQLMDEQAPLFGQAPSRQQWRALDMLRQCVQWLMWPRNDVVFGDDVFAQRWRLETRRKLAEGQKRVAAYHESQTPEEREREEERMRRVGLLDLAEQWVGCVVRPAVRRPNAYDEILSACDWEPEPKPQRSAERQPRQLSPGRGRQGRDETPEPHLLPTHAVMVVEVVVHRAAEYDDEPPEHELQPVVVVIAPPAEFEAGHAAFRQRQQQQQRRQHYVAIDEGMDAIEPPPQFAERNGAFRRSRLRQRSLRRPNDLSDRPPWR